jgi:hypothetical protein
MVGTVGNKLTDNPAGDASFLRILCLKFDRPEFNTKNGTMRGILKLSLTFCSNSNLYGGKIAILRQFLSR